MDAMFQRCTSLTSLDISNFNTSNIITMKGIFLDCTSLLSLDMSSFSADIIDAEISNSIFVHVPKELIIYVCNIDVQDKILNSLDSAHRPSSWNTSNVVIKT